MWSRDLRTAKGGPLPAPFAHRTASGSGCTNPDCSARDGRVTSAPAPHRSNSPTVTSVTQVKLSEGQEEFEVDASAYMAELRAEVELLRAELLQALSHALHALRTLHALHASHAL